MNPMNNSLKFLSELDKQSDIILIAHTSPDGDTICSCLALFELLKKCGKNVQLVCDCVVPPILSFFENSDKFIMPEDAVKSPCVMTVDCSDTGRLGRAYPLFENADVTFCIDHHITNTAFADYNIIDAEAAATAQVVYFLSEFAKNNKQNLKIDSLGDIDKNIASYLYGGILTDTGRFAYSNSTADTFYAASKLVEFGIDVSDLCEKLFMTIPLRKSKLLGYCLEKSKLFSNERIAYSFLPLAVVKEYNAGNNDTEGIVENLRNIDTVEVAVFVRQDDENRYKISTRSKKYFDVSELCRKYGGGGHKRAAGFNFEGDIDSFIDNLIAEIGNEL